jgi:hypothetical protein
MMFGAAIVKRRRAFNVTECCVALALLGLITMTMAHFLFTSIVQGRQHAESQQVLEAAANILEGARACDWEALTPQWARAQRLPAGLAEALERPELVVGVEAEPSRPLTRRITVEVRWLQDGKPAPTVKLVELRSARSLAHAGGKP